MKEMPRPRLVERIRASLRDGRPLLLAGPSHFRKRSNLIAACAELGFAHGARTGASVALPERDGTLRDVYALDRHMALATLRAAGAELHGLLAEPPPWVFTPLAVSRLSAPTVVPITGAETIFAPGDRPAPRATMELLRELRGWTQRAAAGEAGWKHLRVVFVCDVPLWAQRGSRLGSSTAADVPVLDDLDVVNVVAYSPEEAAEALLCCYPTIDRAHRDAVLSVLGGHPWIYERCAHDFPLDKPERATPERVQDAYGPLRHLVTLLLREAKSDPGVAHAVRLLHREGESGVERALAQVSPDAVLAAFSARRCLLRYERVEP